MKSLSHYKMIIKVVLLLTIALIVFLTFQAIYETDNWEPFNIDFDSRNHIILAYGSLLGGILAFLSILFVLYQVYEQRQQILTEKEEAKNKKKQDLRDRLQLLSSYLGTMQNDIKSQGKRLKEFIDAEKENPSVINYMLFNTNKNFERVIEMDMISNFKAFQSFFCDNDWQDQFINLYDITDFYNESFKELKEKHSRHIEDKVKRQMQISYDFRKLMNANSKLLTDYRKYYGKEIYLEKSWSRLANEIIYKNEAYMKDIDDKGDIPNFRDISDNLLKPFIDKAVDIVSDEGFDKFGSITIVELASNIRKEIWLVETYSKQYADNLETFYEKYFSSKNKNLEELLSERSVIDDVLKKK